eukprot:Seg2554.4 transcript_id=Seg2554.4/GoldUCD/mRNA.D3Y31 product="hypothetical protein" protein_id=Seg2554.4/GoldUCD/D3Y31
MLGRGKGPAEDQWLATENHLKAHVTQIGLGGYMDVMYKPMEMMFKAQSLDQYLWSITKWWPKVKAMLLTMQRMIEEQLNEVDVVLPLELFPKLHEHYEDLMKRDPTGCTFKKIELYPGWVVSNETEAVDGSSRKKKKVIKWVDRTPAN